MIIKYTVKGLVQGIGYRPWVAKLADELNIDGWVRNTGGIVSILASGEEKSLQILKLEFLRRFLLEVS
ncbi:Hydrogenase maturation factor [Butyrivibrio fibrisolvens 16/4]|nr:Hydrogenase maturation factor [Butyrivibrio fibrisolvens 16/4]